MGDLGSWAHTWGGVRWGRLGQMLGRGGVGWVTWGTWAHTWARWLRSNLGSRLVCVWGGWQRSKTCARLTACLWVTCALLSLLMGWGGGDLDRCLGGVGWGGVGWVTWGTWAHTWAGWLRSNLGSRLVCVWGGWQRSKTCARLTACLWVTCALLSLLIVLLWTGWPYE